MKTLLLLLCTTFLALGISGNANAASITLYATDDAGVTDAFPNSTYNSGLFNIRETAFDLWFLYTKFDLSSIPDGSIIDSASLSIYLVGYSFTPGEPGRTWDVHYVSGDSWNETSITWNTRPAEDSMSLGSGYMYRQGTSTANLGTPDFSADLLDDTLSLMLRVRPPRSGNTNSLSGYFNTASLSLDYTAVPIPGAVWLLGSGLVGLVGYRKKFKKS